ncbi:hypothetical protein TIFTF001_018005 [Ficus carica]|uniref:Uncharacterized protein n=1 Tax=Ficus carica TaxID=3494 RepID=A0AA88AV35_FICCA|nr:hypothetical protein TIFTF001_018005 [Ficus carica]
MRTRRSRACKWTCVQLRVRHAKWTGLDWPDWIKLYSSKFAEALWTDWIIA